MRHLIPRVRSLFPFALILAVGGFVRAEAQLPRVIITLMPDVPYERVFGHYVLYGPFGAQGGFVRKPSSRADSDSDRSRRQTSKPDQDVYRGARMQDGDLRYCHPKYLLDTQESFSCNPAPTVTLVGQIRPASLLRNKDATVSVDYMAGWACGFFGFGDCMVPQISLGTVKPDTDGIFKIDLPDFSADPIGSDADSGTGLQLILRDAKRTTFSRSSIQSRKRFAIRAAL